VDGERRRGAAASLPFECMIRCALPLPGSSHLEDSCERSDADGVLPAQIIRGFATRANLGVTCTAVSFRIQNADGAENCRDGFVPRF
jgi:hypothetical protein